MTNAKSIEKLGQGLSDDSTKGLLTEQYNLKNMSREQFHTSHKKHSNNFLRESVQLKNVLGNRKRLVTCVVKTFLYTTWVLY